MLGRLNVNVATREQLLTVPGIDPAVVDAILKQREAAPITSLGALPLAPETTEHLKTNGDSDYRRIRRLPLQVLDTVQTASRYGVRSRTVPPVPTAYTLSLVA